MTTCLPDTLSVGFCTWSTPGWVYTRIAETEAPCVHPESSNAILVIPRESSAQ